MLDTPVRLSGIATSLCAALLLALAIGTGGSQGLFQLYQPAESYASLLVARAGVLRIDLGVDMVFIAAYGSFFLLWSRAMLKTGHDPLLVGIGLALVGLTAVLDAAENAHILTMLRMAEAGQSLSGAAIAAQQVASQVKFHAAYCGMALLGLTWMPKPEWRWIRLVFLFQLVMGLAIFIAAGSVLQMLYLMRGLFFALGPILVLLSAPARTAQ